VAEHLGAARAMSYARAAAAGPGTTTLQDEHLPVQVRLGYGAGSLATGMFSTVPAILLLFYCTEVLHVPAGWAALIVLLPKAWSVAWDPIVGSLSDRAASLRGLLITGATGVVACFALLFAGPWHGVLAAGVWAGCCYFGLATFYSLYAVPYVSLPARRVRSDTARARLVSGRMVFAMLGVLAGAGVAPVIVQLGATPRAGYRLMGCCLALACALAMIAPIRALKSLPPPRRQAAPTGAPMDSQSIRLPDQLRTVLASRQLRAQLLSYLLQLTASGILSAAAPYEVTYIFRRPAGDTGLALGLLLVATTLSIPLWAALARHYGERRALTGAVLGYAAATCLLGAAILGPVPWPQAVGLFVLIGLPFGGLQVLPFIISARIIARDGGGVAEGALTGLWTASEKLGLAFGPTITGAAFAVFGGLQSQGLRILLMLLPAGLVLLSLRFAPAAPSPAPGLSRIEGTP